MYSACPRGDDAPHNGAAVYTSAGDLVWAGSGAGFGDCFDLQTQTVRATMVLKLMVADMWGIAEWHRGPYDVDGFGARRGLG
jgi:hypothetical protein